MYAQYLDIRKHVYCEFSLICCNISPEIWWINVFDGLTRYSLVLVRTYVYYVGSGYLWQIKRRINFNSLYVGLCTCGSQNACMYIS